MVDESPGIVAKPSAPSIVLIEDQTLLRQVIRVILRSERGWTDVTEFANGEEGLRHCLASPPDLVLVDLDLPGKNGLDVAKELRGHAPQTRIMILSANRENVRSTDLMALGVNGYVNKVAPYDHLLKAIDVVMSGAFFFSADLAVAARSEGAARVTEDEDKGVDPRSVLTEQELVIARKVVAGLASKEIGAELGLTARSVDKHRANIMEKLGVRQVAGVVRLCVRHGIY